MCGSRHWQGTRDYLECVLHHQLKVASLHRFVSSGSFSALGPTKLLCKELSVRMWCRLNRAAGYFLRTNQILAQCRSRALTVLRGTRKGIILGWVSPSVHLRLTAILQEAAFWGLVFYCSWRAHAETLPSGRLLAASTCIASLWYFPYALRSIPLSFIGQSILPRRYRFQYSFSMIRILDN